MSNLFGNLTTDNLEESGDRLGSGGTLPTGLYENATVKLVYAGKSKSSESRSVTVHLDIDGREIRETHWVTNRTGTENFYQDKNDPTKKHPLPGFTTVNDLCLLITGQELSQQAWEEKVVKLYDFDAKEELPQNVPVLMAVIGKKISVGLIEQIVDKNVKQGDKYVPSGDTRTENVVDKFFHAESRRTVSEIRKGKQTGEFIDKWAEKNNGKPPRDKSTKDVQGSAGAPGKPKAADSAAPKKSLFDS